MQAQPIEACPAPKRVRVEGVPNLYRRTKDGKYEAGFTGADGKWHIKTLRARTLTEAKRELRALHVGVDRGEEVAPSRRTFRVVAQEFLDMCESRVAAGEMAPRTLDHYRGDLDRHVLPKLGRHEIQKVTPDMLARFLAEKCASGLSPWSCRGLLTPLGRIFALAVRRNYINENPLRRLDSSELPKGKKKSEPRVLTRNELTGCSRRRRTSTDR
jgi:integrase